MTRMLGHGGRSSSRHTGRQFGSGYQFRPPKEFALSYGPWQGLALGASTEPDWLADLQTGIIRNGGVQLHAVTTTPTTSSISSATPLGSFLFTINGQDMHFLFYKDTTTGYINVFRTLESGTTGTHASTLTATNSKRIVACVWGDLVYFASNDLANIYTYDYSTGTFAAVSGSPAAVEYMEIIDNNLVAGWYDTSSLVWVIEWAVDSDPTDWSSEGHGTQILSGDLGKLQRLLKINETGFIACAHGGQVMAPTGTIPAFAFSDAAAFLGARFQYGACTDGLGVLYYSYDDKVHYWSSSQDRLFNATQAANLNLSNASNNFYYFEYSKHLGAAAFHYYNSIASRQGIVLYDSQTMTVVGNLAGAIATTPQVFSDSIALSSSTIYRGISFFFVQSGLQIAFRNTDVLSASIGTTIGLSPINFGTEVELLYVDVFTDADPVGTLTLKSMARDGTSTSYSISPAAVSMGESTYQYFRMPVHVHGSSFYVSLSLYLSTRGQSVRKIRCVFALQDALEAGRIG